MTNSTRVPAAIRRAVFERDHYTCRYCRGKDGPLSVEHSLPRVMDGDNTMENLVTSCTPCNTSKNEEHWIPLSLEDALTPDGTTQPIKLGRGRIKRTSGHLTVAKEFMGDPEGEHYGYTICRDTGIKPGVLYPILARFEKAGLLVSSWQSPDEMVDKQYLPRRYYTLTEKGRAELGALIADTEVAK